MGCFKPILASKRMQPNGKNLIRFKHDPHPDAVPIRLPCGQCTGCRLDRAKSWAVRCMHEASLHDQSCFLTLTYSEDALPVDESLTHPHIQDFFKRLRYHLKIPLRYYMCGEYGENGTKRPHYHIILFGYKPTDLIPYGVNKIGQTLNTSPQIEQIWQKGNIDVSDVTFESCSYVARYIMKKQLGNDANYSHITQHGLVTDREPEYTAMSRKPGIAKDWFDLYHSDIFPHDELQVLNKKGVHYAKIPRYYDNLMDQLDPELMASIKEKREIQAHENFPTDLQLHAKSVITQRKLDKLKRELE